MVEDDIFHSRYVNEASILSCFPAHSGFTRARDITSESNGGICASVKVG